MTHFEVFGGHFFCNLEGTFIYGLNEGRGSSLPSLPLDARLLEVVLGDSSVTCVTFEGRSLTHFFPHARPNAKLEINNLVNYY